MGVSRVKKEQSLSHFISAQAEMKCDVATLCPEIACVRSSFHFTECARHPTCRLWRGRLMDCIAPPRAHNSRVGLPPLAAESGGKHLGFPQAAPARWNARVEDPLV